MKGFLHKGLIISWALAVFYLHLGSLVNFHQHHLWKKFLIPTVIAAKKEKKEESAFVVKVKYHSGNAGFKFDPVTSKAFAFNYSEFSGNSGLILFSGDMSVCQTDLPRSLSLRAPPIA